MRLRPGALLIGLAIGALGSVALRLGVGPDGLEWPRDATEWSLRGARAASGAAVGGSLAIAGVFLQALLRNPLAEPAVLGLTSGAGLGVVVSLYLSYLTTGAMLLYRPPAEAALLGALAVLALVGVLGQRRGVLEPFSLVLTGVVVSLICGAGIVFVQHLLPDQGMAMASRWTFGAISDDVPTWWIVGVGALAMLSSFAGIRWGPAMDAATLSDDEARSLGVRLGVLRAGLFIASGALSAGAVLLAGPIGFVGLVCPHAVRLLCGARHRVVVPTAGLMGWMLIVLADAGVRVFDVGSGRMPIGVLTALLGGPVFLWLLRRERTWL
ncbi:MAG: FecCD family ABC transporter permease [Phycisphaerales bacterium]